MRTLLLPLCGLYLLLLAAFPATAGDPQYPAATIPAELKAGAHAVKRWEEVQFKLTGAGEARLVNHYVITVLDEAGSRHALMREWYDKLRTVRSIRGVLYDGSGKAIKKLKQSDVIDEAAGDGVSMITDNRVKQHAFYYNVYPYTVEYEITTDYSCTAFFPRWVPQDDHDMAVEQSRLVVNVPQQYQLRYRQVQYEGAPQVTTEKDIRTYTWEARQIKTRPDEIMAPAWSRRTTSVWLAPSDFEMGGFKGNMNSWETYGRFIYTLNKNRDELTDAAKQTVHRLTDAVSDTTEKIRILYQYLQQHTRYVSIQLGIGGWQTFDAAYVADKGYGDCKALSNYMCALLKEAGITGYCTLVHSGYGETAFENDFPSDQFNHVITCVPRGKDTTWLECTSPYLPAGYLSGFTADRPVLVVTENGGKLVHTPVYGSQLNQQLRRLEAHIMPDGNVQAQVRTISTGQQQDELRLRLHMLSREKLMEWIRTSLALPSYDVNSYSCQEQSGAAPAIAEQLDITARNYVSISGRRMFIEPNILNKSSMRISTEEQRRSDIQRVFAYTDVDTVLLTIPAGYKPELLPKPTLLKSRFGTYAAMVLVKDSTLTYIRTMQCNAGTFPASAFSELEKFYDDVFRADRSRIVLVKNE
ncbi:MAG TPA: DUF3857 and transglutaminase domain-containing protein [Chitinophaga sp.]|uniref:DUF3857 domain-containing transglutaminase family protein n=1 Tax=Chitinophaga sp. TaxID=1869181 RepID=UPI002DB93A8A|nr:DUF3857 and transglutaminase domain-containing protein [Chitinophaga sp.]HEU4551597.1 DUF3857 and transglutaminase domain-containing protein [Chitinophaga sp.]